MREVLKMDLENYIETQYREIVEYINIEFIDLYESFKSEKLQKIFSTIHHLMVENYKIMNQRLPTRECGTHFWAEPSRELLLAINVVTSMHRALKNTKFSFSFDEYYKKVIKESEEFLSNSGGSEIPPNMEKVQLYYTIPILKPTEVISINSLSDINKTADIKIIGEGSYAKVFSYIDPFYGKKFVLKRAKNDLSDKEKVRFKNEYEEMKNLSSPYVVEVYNFNDQKTEYTMEYMDKTLESYINENNTVLKQTDRKNLSLQILKAFKYIHSKNLLHRDISPNNILIKIYDDVNVVKISDFGLVKTPDSKLTSLNTDFKGCFNDPGLVTYGFSNYGIEHETYAITRLIYFVLTGRKNINNIKNKNLSSFINKGLSTNLKERFKSVDEIIDFLYKI